MIKVTRYFKGNQLLGFKFRGHSGYAECGSDIVCAAVSALAQSTLNGLRNIVKAPLKFKIDDSVPLVEFMVDSELSQTQTEQTEVLLLTLSQAVEDLVREWNKFIKLEDQNVY